MTQGSAPVLVLGLGNVLCGDDGVGVVVAHRLLRGYEIPGGVKVLDGGTLGLALLSHLEGAREVILIDAVRADASPGSFIRLEGDEVAPAARDRLSPHQIGVADLLDSLELLGTTPARMILLGLVPETLELGLGLSPKVEESIPLLEGRVVEELERLGRPLTPRAGDGAAPGPPGLSDPDRALGL